MIVLCSLRQLHSLESFFQLVRIYCSFVFIVHLYLSVFIYLRFSPLERSPPIEEVIQSGVVPRFVEFLMREDFAQLQVLNIFEAVILS